MDVYFINDIDGYSLKSNPFDINNESICFLLEGEWIFCIHIDDYYQGFSGDKNWYDYNIIGEHRWHGKPDIKSCIIYKEDWSGRISGKLGVINSLLSSYNTALENERSADTESIINIINFLSESKLLLRKIEHYFKDETLQRLSSNITIPDSILGKRAPLHDVHYFPNKSFFNHTFRTAGFSKGDYFIIREDNDFNIYVVENFRLYKKELDFDYRLFASSESKYIDSEQEILDTYFKPFSKEKSNPDFFQNLLNGVRNNQSYIIFLHHL